MAWPPAISADATRMSRAKRTKRTESGKTNESGDESPHSTGRAKRNINIYALGCNRRRRASFRATALADNRCFSQNVRMKSHSTTILTVRHRGMVALGGDGQVTLGTTVMKGDANKIRRMLDGKVITGFAGAAADAFALLERFEAKLKDYPSNVPRAATELAKEWRTDRVLRRLEALMAVVDARHTLLVTGNGDVIQPTDGVLGIGSGGSYAVAAARALVAHSDLSAAQIVRKSLEIAAGIDIYTNTNITVEELPCET